MAWRWLSVCVGLLLLAEHPKGAEGETEEEQATDEEYNTCVGHVIALPCGDADESDNVTWSRWGAPPLDTAVAGVEVRGGALWFLPANSSHSGIYICNRSGADLWHAKLYVGSGVCPEYNIDDDLNLDYPGRLKCRGQDHIFKYGANLHITWLKDCTTPLNKSEKILQFPWVTIRDKGHYTCQLHFSLEGHNYTSASTIRVSIDVPKQLSSPRVIVPINGTRERVKLKSRHELRCEVSTGNSKTLVSWRTKDLRIIENNTDFTIEETVLGSRVVTTLIISEVRKEHLNTPFLCWALNAVDQDFSQICLEAANQDLFYCMVGLGVICGLLLVCVSLCWHFRLDLVLLFRSLCPLRKQYDGKLYDAYVSYPSGNSISMAMTFALQVLPEFLESKYGYKLFIRGRDDLPGEAVYDVIDNALAKSRRLLIVLDGTTMETHTQTHTHKPAHTETIPLTDAQTKTHMQLDTQIHGDTNTHQEIIPLTFTQTHTNAHTQSDTHTHPASPMQWDPHSEQVCVDGHPEQACFEHTLVQYEALVNSGLKVVIVQTGEGEGASSLPPPLKLLTHSRRPLRWHTHTRTHSLGQQRFWKELRYRMPAPRRTHPENAHTHITAF